MAKENDDINNAIFTSGLFGILCGTVLTLAPIIYKDSKPNPFKNRPIVSKYMSAATTLGTLKEEREKLALNLPYQPEHIKPELEKIFEERQKTIGSLDNTIGLIEADMKSMENNQEFQQYKSWKYSSTGADVIVKVGIAVSGLGLLTALFGQCYNFEKKGKGEKK